MSNTPDFVSNLQSLLGTEITPDNAGQLYGSLTAAQRNLMKEEENIDAEVFVSLDQGTLEALQRVNNLLSKQLPQAIRREPKETSVRRIPATPDFKSFPELCKNFLNISVGLKIASTALSDETRLEIAAKIISILRSPLLADQSVFDEWFDSHPENINRKSYRIYFTEMLHLRAAAEALPMDDRHAWLAFCK